MHLKDDRIRYATGLSLGAAQRFVTKGLSTWNHWKYLLSYQVLLTGESLNVVLMTISLRHNRARQTFCRTRFSVQPLFYLTNDWPKSILRSFMYIYADDSTVWPDFWQLEHLSAGKKYLVTFNGSNIKHVRLHHHEAIPEFFTYHDELDLHYGIN